MSHDAARAQFQENLNLMTKPCPQLGLVKVYLDGHLIRTIAGVPGQAGALRVFANVHTDGVLTTDARARAMEIFAPFVQEAKANPGTHPTIDLLLALRADQNLRIETIETSPDLFAKLLEGSASQGEKQAAVDLLDKGLVRCAEKLRNYRITSNGVELSDEGTWVTQPYGVACMNAGFSAYPMTVMGEGFYDKVPLKTEGWTEADFTRAGVRFIPGSFARRGAYIGSGTTIMPGGIVNIGAYVAGAGVMIDGGARVATGAQIGKAVKLGAGSGVEGILEPAGRLPSIVEDNVRVGANCELCGIVEEGAVVASGVVMASGKKIFDLRTRLEVEPRYMSVGETLIEIPVIPKNRVAVGGVYLKDGTFGVDCILLLEKDAGETSLAQLPRNAQLYLKV
jgi:2,3,4,5-tetrahydropyridine-2,6-dicarboxylate N-succinyltransferase